MSVSGARKYICFKDRTYRKALSVGGESFGSGSSSLIPKCPTCSQNMVHIGQFTKIPKKKDLKGWKKLESIISRSVHLGIKNCYMVNLQHKRSKLYKKRGKKMTYKTMKGTL